MQYRRHYTEGGSYFFTVNLAERKRRLLVEHIDALREAIRIVSSRHPFQIDAIVVMPDHLHAIFTLPTGDADYPTRWMLIKAGFSRRIPKNERINASRQSKGERGVWQRRFWEHTIQDEADFRHHIDYIHYNPVKHGYVSRPADWPHSSIHKYIRAGTLPADWGTGSPENDKRFGERRLGWSYN